MAKGQATGLTRKLASTITTLSTKATISSQVTGLPQTWKAGASAGRAARSKGSSQAAGTICVG